MQTKKNVIQEQEYFIKSEREGDFYPIILVDTIIWYMLLMRGKQEGSSGRWSEENSEFLGLHLSGNKSSMVLIVSHFVQVLSGYSISKQVGQTLYNIYKKR